MAVSLEEIAMRLGLINWPRVMLAAMAIAMWPVWRWYVLRMSDGSDEPYGLLALGTLIFVLMRSGIELPRDERRFICAAMLIAVYALLFRAWSPLPRAIVAAAAVATVCIERRNAVTHAALLGLSLPVVATAQFYLGYPLRIMAAEATAIALQALEFGVTREGTLLHWRGEFIMVDAPCSGIRMLWFGMYLAASLAALNRLSNRRSLVLLAVTFVLVVAANVVRAATLFFKEAHIITLPDWTHVGIVIVLFATATLPIVHLATRKEIPGCAA